MSVRNRFGQEVGESLIDWVEPVLPRPDLAGRHVTLTQLAADHAGELLAVFEPAPDSLWTYMSFGPFDEAEQLRQLIEFLSRQADWQTFAVMVDGTPVGFAAFLRIDQGAGTIEIGSIAFSPALQRTTAATETIFLLIDHAVELGYRRVEWKCDSLNEPSRRAAERFGFGYEGTFRQATHYKGRNRDTAWYSIIDSEWEAIRGRFVEWLTPSNFDADGLQITPLRAR